MIITSPSRSAPEVAFVLPAGGSAGATQVGILASLVEAGIFPDVLVGCSVGALNAAFFALDPTLEQVDRLEQLWADLSTRSVFGDHRHRAVVRLLRKRDHLWSPAPLRALIRRCCPIADLADLALPVHVVTTDLDIGAARWWSRGPAQEVLYASACLPGLLPRAPQRPPPRRRRGSRTSSGEPGGRSRRHHRLCAGRSERHRRGTRGHAECVGRPRPQFRHKPLRAPPRPRLPGPVGSEGDCRARRKYRRDPAHRLLPHRPLDQREPPSEPPVPVSPATARRRRRPRRRRRSTRCRKAVRRRKGGASIRTTRRGTVCRGREALGAWPRRRARTSTVVVMRSPAMPSASAHDRASSSTATPKALARSSSARSRSWSKVAQNTADTPAAATASIPTRWAWTWSGWP